ncbi:MAG: putative PEP-binding protein [Alkalispirochaeta sp.]
MSDIVLFGDRERMPDQKALDLVGSRGARAVSLADLDVPVCPGFVVSSPALTHFPDNTTSAWAILKDPVETVESRMSRRFGGSEQVLLLKAAESPMLNVRSALPSVHHVGLCESTLEGFAASAGETFAYKEYGFLISSILKLELVTCEDQERRTALQTFREELIAAKRKSSIVKVIDQYRELLPAEFFTEPYFQLSYVLRLFRAAFTTSPTSEDSAVLVQAMVYGNFDDESSAGYFYSHNIISGADELQGEFFPKAFDENEKKGKALDKLSEDHFQQLSTISRKLEDHFREIRFVRFTIESGVLWLVDQASVPNKSAQAEIKTLLDLMRRDVVSDRYVIQTIKPGRLSEILHPTLDKASVKGVPTMKGGIAGSVGAAIGRVYFSTDRLIAAVREAQIAGTDTNAILAMPSTFAGDVKAIEVAQGVLSSEGGYASHAPVVARSLGKVALVRSDITFRSKSMVIDGNEIKEGDYLTMDVPYYEDPVMYVGRGDLTKPTPEDSGLLELLDVIQPHLTGMDVHANADQPRDAELARMFKAQGIGLCRTEHMFFDESRINRFRYLILANSDELRSKALEDLRVDQTKDFYDLFKIMEGLPVTIRLLDAPLHEFLPQTKDAMQAFVKQAQADKTGFTKASIESSARLLQEFNPMLGHRGVRIAISYPEIYRMQLRAIFDAAYKLKKEGVDVKPEIMIPLVMTPNELKVIRNGKRIEGKHILGIRDIEDEIREQHKTDPIEYAVGTMIELPAAALNGGEISRYADFFSFGTNDLTQTTYGISRDDFNNFFSDYNEFDLLPSNPFKVLQQQVRELILTASMRGRMVRPDLKLGLCGEHGAEPENVEFFRDAGLNYTSVSPYGIPIAKLAIAQMNLKDAATG